jgi:ADP-heptose:LPS heptosyltransferase
MGGAADKLTGDAIADALPERNIINGCGSYNIHQSASLVRQCKVLITHDTGLMHIGAAFNRKIVSIWGNTIPKFGMYPFRPDPASVEFEVAGLKCRPCSKIGYQQCPKKHFNCMIKQDLGGIAQATNRLFLTTAR